MRIGVNALYLIPGGVGGTEIYLRNLLRHLAAIDSENRYFVFTNAETGDDLVPPQSNFVPVPQRVRAVSRPARILWEQTMLPLRASRLGLDVLFNPGFTAPVICRCPMVTVFHDLQHKRHPQYFSRLDLPFWRILLFASARRSRLLLADSHATAADLGRFYGMAPPKVRVAHLGVDPVFAEVARRRSPERYLLCVSTLHPHKNLDRLLSAFAAFRRERPGFRLVIAGLRGFYTAPLERLRRELGLEAAVEFTGWIERSRVLDLYAGAWAFLYPSTFEGFGLPVLEALAAGVPVACSRIDPLEEVAGDAALYFEPADVAGITRAMLEIACDEGLRAELVCRGLPRAARFGWEQTARKTLDALREAAGQ